MLEIITEIQLENKMLGVVVILFPGKTRIPRVTMGPQGVEVLAGVMDTLGETVVLEAEAMATEVVTMLHVMTVMGRKGAIMVIGAVVMVYAAAIMALDAVRGDRSLQVFGTLMGGILIKTLITTAYGLPVSKN